MTLGKLAALDPDKARRAAKEVIGKAGLAARRRAAKSAGEDENKVQPLPRWTLHDLRRTVVTGMNEMGIQPHVVEAVVGPVLRWTLDRRPPLPRPLPATWSRCR